MPVDKKRPQKYCSIFNWIKDNDDDFATVMSDLCLDRVASVSYNTPSVTFLMPKGELRKKIMTAALSEKPEDAVDMITSLVIPYWFPTLKSFTKSPPELIGNKLGFMFPEISESSDDKIKFGKILTIKPTSSKFVPMDKYKIYIWEIADGEPPSNVNKLITAKNYVIPKMPKKTGGADGTPKSTILNPTYRFMFAKKVEHLALEDLRKNHTNIYLQVVTYLLNILNSKTYYNLFLKIRPIVDFDPVITFYLLVEPYKNTEEYLISSDVFTEKVFERALKSHNIFNYSVTEFINVMNKQLPGECLCFNNSLELIDAINKIRFNILNNDQVRAIPDTILNLYNKLQTNNEINIDNIVLTNVLPDSLYLYYKNNEYKKLWEDEFRFVVGEYLYSIKMEPEYKTKKHMFLNLCELIRNIIPGNNYVSELSIMNTTEYVLSTCLKDKIKMMQYFVNSPDFLYIGYPFDLITKVISPAETDCGTGRIKFVKQELENMVKMSIDSDDVIKSIPSYVRQKLFSRLQQFINDHKESLCKDSDSDSSSSSSSDDEK